MSAIAPMLKQYNIEKKYDKYIEAQTLPQIISIARGGYNNSQIWYVFGRDKEVTTSPTFHDVWAGGSTAAGAYSSHKMIWHETASYINVYSDHIDDYYQGPGAWTVQIRGIGVDEDSGLWIFQREIVQLNGITPVQTTKKFIRVQDTTITSAGNVVDVESTCQAGNLFLIHVDEDTLADFVLLETDLPNPATGQSCRVTCPDGYIGFFLYVTFTPDSNKSVTFTLNRMNHTNPGLENGDPILNFEGMRTGIAFADNIEAPLVYDLYNNPFPLSPKSDLWLTATAAASASVSSFGIFLFLEL